MENDRPILELAPSPPKGEVPQKVMDELVSGRTRARYASEDFSSAIKRIAKKHSVNPKALRSVVCALEDDKRLELRKVVDATDQLLRRNERVEA